MSAAGGPFTHWHYWQMEPPHQAIITIIEKASV
jgi:hypothetical protein